MSTAADPKVAPDTRASRKKANRHLSDRARGERKLGWMLAGPAFVIMVGVTAYPILQAVYTRPVDKAIHDQTLKQMEEHLTKTHGFPMPTDQFRRLASIYEMFYGYGPGITYQNSNRGNAYPTYWDMQVTDDGQGRNHAYLQTDAAFQAIKRMYEANLIVPVIGNFGGPKAIRAVGAWARAHGGVLYIDEVNLLEDHLVDLLIDVAASGENLVEREGLSLRHPARFVLVGSGNPEEGELRPQLLDRFGLSVDVKTPQDLDLRMDVILRRDAFERDPAGFRAEWQAANDKLQKRVVKARKLLPEVKAGADVLRLCADLCQRLGTDGLRAELTLMRASRACAALHGAKAVTPAHLKQIAVMALRHRLRRDPLDDTDSGVRVQRTLDEVLGA